MGGPDALDNWTAGLSQDTVVPYFATLRHHISWVAPSEAPSEYQFNPHTQQVMSVRSTAAEERARHHPNEPPSLTFPCVGDAMSYA